MEVGSQTGKRSSQQLFWHFDFFFFLSFLHLLLHFFFCFFVPVLHFLILIPAFLQSMSMRTLHGSSSGGDSGDGGDGGAQGGSGSHKPQVVLHCFLHCVFLHCFAVLHLLFLHFVEVSTHGGLGAAQSTYAAPMITSDSSAEGQRVGSTT